MELTGELHTLIRSIYRSAAAPARWEEFLELLKRQLRADWAAISLTDRFRPHRRVNAVVGAQGSRTVAPQIQGTVLVSPLLTAMLSAGRSRDTSFGAAEQQLFFALLPHIGTAFRMYQELLAETRLGRAGRAALNRLGIPILICDATATILHRTEAATALLSDSCGLLVERNGRLTARVLDDRHPLEDAFAAALASDVGSASARHVVRLGGTARDAARAIVVPVVNDPVSELRRSLVAVLVLDMRRPTPNSAKRMRQLYPFTRAEAAVAARLFQGDTIDSAAGALGISRETVRTHVKRLFQKTGTSRQAQLIRVLAASLVQPQPRTQL